MAKAAANNNNIIQRFNSTAYQLEEKIGEGGFGSVYRARQLNTGQTVAIKFLVMSRELDEDKRQRYADRFEREAQLSSCLQHPNIVRLLDKGFCDDCLFYAVFEYVDGKSLKEALLDDGSLSPIETVEVMGQVLEALSHAHEQGVIHRDIKPANIMLMRTDTRTYAKVLDFGIGTFASEARQQDYKTLTLTQETLGTPSYSAPEQLRGEPPTVKTDIYVWALVFIECLTGRPTITGSTVASIFHKQLSQSNVPLPAALTGHPVAALLRRALQKKVHERTITTQALYRELHQLNLSSLVGDIAESGHQGSLSEGTELETLVNQDTKIATTLTERKQITAVGVCLQARKVSGEVLDSEVIDALHRDQKNQCIDIAIRYGAYHVGTLGDTLLFYFGYPAVSENDARLAARAVLDITGGLAKRNALLKQTQSLTIHARVGMHTGIVTCYADATPEGDTPGITLELSRLAHRDQVLCSETSYRILEPYIEFEPDQICNLGIAQDSVRLHCLKGERQVEAFGFLRQHRHHHAFIGREQELSQLLDFVREQKANTQQTVAAAHIYGEAGVGKSRLIFELRERASHYQHYVAQCLPEHQNNALYPILNLLKYQYGLDSLAGEQVVALLLRLADHLESTLSDTEKPPIISLKPAIPILLTWLNIRLPEDVSPSELSPEAQKQQLFNALIVLLMHNEQSLEYRGEPTAGGADSQGNKLFIFEDLHWADPSSLEFLGQFISALGTAGHRLMTTSRQPMSTNLASAHVQSLPLNRLTPQATQDFISTLFDGETVSAKLLAVLESRTDGIPLFIEELVNMLRQKALVQKLNGIIEFSSPENLDQVPNSLRDSLQQKLDTLVYAKETAQLAATIGREFDYALLVSASDYDEELVQNDLNELLEAELIIQQRKVKGGRYLFKHALIRDAAYESTTKSNLLKFNLDVATALLAEGFHEPFRVAEHFALAEEWQPGVEHGLQALQESARNSVNLETITIYHQLEQWLTHLPEDTRLVFEKQAIDLTYSAYMAVYGLGSAELLALRQRRSELDQQGEAELSEAEVHPEYLQKWAEYQQLHFGGKIVEAQQLAEEILEDARSRDNRIEQLLLLPLLGQTYHFLGRLEEGMACCNKALALYHDEDDLQLWQKYGVEPKSQALFLMSHIQAFYGQFKQAIDSCNQSEIWARKSGCSMSVDGAATFKAIAYYHQQDRAGTSSVTGDYAAKVKGVREPEWLEGYIVSLDDWANDESDFAQSFIMGLWQSDSYGAASLWLPMLCQLLVEQDPGFVEDLTRDAIQKCMAMEQIAAVPLLHRCLAVAKCRLTDNPEAIDYDYFRQGYQLAMDLKAYGIVLDIAVFWLEHSQATPFEAEATEALGHVLGYFTEDYDVPVLRQARSLLRQQSS